MGRVSAKELEQHDYDNYRACYEGEAFIFHAVSVRQAWYKAFEHFGDECVDYLAEIDQDSEVVDIIMDKEDVY